MNELNWIERKKKNMEQEQNNNNNKSWMYQLYVLVEVFFIFFFFSYSYHIFGCLCVCVCLNQEKEEEDCKLWSIKYITKHRPNVYILNIQKKYGDSYRMHNSLSLLVFSHEKINRLAIHYPIFTNTLHKANIIDIDTVNI